MPSDSPPAVNTANDRFKQGFGRWFWMALTTATLAHAGLFLLAPDFPIRDVTIDRPDGITMVPSPDVPIPERPPEVARPAAPVVGGPDVDPTLTIAPTDLASHPPAVLAPPATGGETEPGPHVTPMTIRPRLENAAEVRQALERFYPPLLRDARIGGTVHVWFYIDTDGRVQRTQVRQSSGYGDLDEAALRVADRMEFSPAYNRDQRVAVWVSLPITFEVRPE